jgi:hypothetical protein
MAYEIGDSIQETSTTTGTGTAKTLDGAVSGFRTAASKLTNGAAATWAMWDDTDEEIFEGTFSSGPDTVTRTTMISSTNGGSPVNWGAGTRNIACVVNGLKLESLVDPTVQSNFGGIHRVSANVYTALIPTMTPGTAVTLTNANGVSGVPAFNDSNAAALDGSAFTGAVSFATTTTFTGKPTFNNSAMRLASTLTWETATGNTARVTQVDATNGKIDVNVSGAWKQLVSEANLPISSLNVGEIPIANGGSSFATGLMQLFSNTAGTNTGTDGHNRKWVITFPIVDTDGSTLRTLKIQGDTKSIANSTTANVTIPSAYTSTVLGVLATMSTTTSVSGQTQAWLKNNGGPLDLDEVVIRNGAGSGGPHDISYIVWGIDTV